MLTRSHYSRIILKKHIIHKSHLRAPLVIEDTALVLAVVSLQRAAVAFAFAVL